MTDKKSGRTSTGIPVAPIASIIVAAGVVAFAAFKNRSEPEPTYSGRKLSSWMNQVTIEEFAEPRPKGSESAMRAIRAIGSKAVLPLAKIAATRQPNAIRLQQLLGNWTGTFLFGERSSDSEYLSHEKAIWCLGELGPIARPALSSVTNSYVWYSKAHIYEAWAKIDPTNALPVQELCTLMKSSKQTDRFFAALALHNFAPDHSGVVEVLIAGLQDTDREVRANCARSLGQIGRAAQSAVPELQREAAASTFGRLRVNAARALWQIDPAQSDFAAKATVQILQSNDPLGALKLLNEMGPAAHAGIPELEAFYPKAPNIKRQRDELLARLRGMTPSNESDPSTGPESAEH
ncbi:MAG: hypothetical protein JWM99_1869 [Verrucomicrobiales bacterium]|nr:hypothetical protein [Verrucomicrobiales bacterium]